MYYYIKGVDTEFLLGFEHIEEFSKKEEIENFLEERYAEYELEDCREISLEEALELQKASLLNSIFRATKVKKRAFVNEVERDLIVFKTAQAKIDLLYGIDIHSVWYKKVRLGQLESYLNRLMEAEYETDAEKIYEEMSKIK